MRKRRKRRSRRREPAAPCRPFHGEDLAGGGASLGGPFPYHVGEDTPLESIEAGHSVPSVPSEQREGSKQPCANEAQPGSGEPTLKHPRPVALR
jgi:hypothetical protein